MLNVSKDYIIYPIELLQIIKEASETYTYVFSKPNELSWAEGAHTHLALDRFNEDIGWFEKKDIRHFSIMTMEDEGLVGITTRLHPMCSDFKASMKDASVGDTYFLFKVGTRLALRRENRPIVLISSGVGIASLRPLMRAFVNNTEGISSLHHITIDSSGEFLFNDEIQEYSNNPLFSNEYTNSRAEFYAALRNVFSGNSNKYYKDAFIYVIGSDEFLFDVRDYLLGCGVTYEQFILDKKSDFLLEFVKKEE